MDDLWSPHQRQQQSTASFFKSGSCHPSLAHKAMSTIIAVDDIPRVVGGCSGVHLTTCSTPRDVEWILDSKSSSTHGGMDCHFVLYQAISVPQDIIIRAREQQHSLKSMLWVFNPPAHTTIKKHK
jgi:hypothetical protein